MCSDWGLQDKGLKFFLQKRLTYMIHYRVQYTQPSLANVDYFDYSYWLVKSQLSFNSIHFIFLHVCRFTVNKMCVWNFRRLPARLRMEPFYQKADTGVSRVSPLEA